MVTKNPTVTQTTSFSSFEPDELLALAQLDVEKGNISDALLKLKQIISDETAPTEAFSICGQVYARLGLWNRAQAMFQKYLDRDPKAVGEKFQLGLMQGYTGRTADAVKVWDELLQNHPAYAPALFYRALVRAQAGQAVPARQDLDMLLKTASVDNPYFKQGKELLQNIDAQQQFSRPAPAATAPEPTPDSRAVLAKNIYKTEP